jgi:hypothetical protein
MGTWEIFFWVGCAVIAPGALYALHRLALRLEERGHFYYLKKKSSGSAAGCFVAWQRALEPQIQHVIHVNAESRLHGEEGASGQGNPDDANTPHTDPNEVSSTSNHIRDTGPLNKDPAPPAGAP